MTDKIKIGDVVFLKSHQGFHMTVGYVSDSGKNATCYWAIDSGESQEVKWREIPICALEVNNPSSSND